MQSKSEYPLNTWRLSHQELRGTDQWNRVWTLSSVRHAAREAYDIGQIWSAYYADHSQPVPDLVAYVGYYGYARLLVQGWTELPIEVPEDQVAAWREWKLGTNFREFYDLNIPGIAGGFMKRAVVDPGFTATTIQTQLHDKSARMVELAHKPVEWFTLAEYTQEEIDEQDRWDDARLDELFDLFDQLTCFIYAMPKLTSFAITEEEEKYGLPNRELYNALQEKIDLNRLYGQLAETEDRLKPILRFLTQHGYSVNRTSAPEGFWWRHWKAERPRQQRHRSTR